MFRCIRVIRCGPWSESKEAHASKVPAAFKRRLPQAPSGASEANDSNASTESNESKVGPKAQDL